jgi:hypothetical protein
MSPHILIDEALDALAHPASEPGSQAVVQRMIINMLKGSVITIEEFNHYCARLNKVSRKEAA